MSFFMRKPAAGAWRTTALLAAAAGAAFWGAAMAAQAGDPPPQQPAADAHSGAAASDKPANPNPDDKVICRVEEETGSRTGARRICHTVREWNLIARNGEDWLEDIQSRSSDYSKK